MLRSRLELVPPPELTQAHLDATAREIVVAERRFQRERDGYRFVTKHAETKLKQYCLWLVHRTRSADGAYRDAVADAAAELQLPVELWQAEEIRETWNELVALERERSMAELRGREPADVLDRKPSAFGERQPSNFSQQGRPPAQHAAAESLGSADDVTRPRPHQRRSVEVPGVTVEPESQNPSEADTASMFEMQPSPRFPWDDMPIRGSPSGSYNYAPGISRESLQPKSPRIVAPRAAAPRRTAPQKLALRKNDGAEGEVEAAKKQLSTHSPGVDAAGSNEQAGNRVGEEADKGIAKEVGEEVADQEEEERLEAQVRQQLGEDAYAEEKAAANREQAPGPSLPLNVNQEKTLKDTREFLLGPLEDADHQMLEAAKKMHGDDVATWSFGQSVAVFNKIMRGT